jgi:hypothetical protein
LNNELMTYDNFVLPYDMKNLTKKKNEWIMAETPQGSH